MQTLDEMKPQQSPELLKSLHILTRDGKINQDSRRKLKQVYHLYNFIEPILENINQENEHYSIVDHGCGKSYLGFILYDLFIKSNLGQVIGIETRSELVEKSKALAKKLKFDRMHFFASDIKNSLDDSSLPKKVDMVTALHACDTATDDAIAWAVNGGAKLLLIAPCCHHDIQKQMEQSPEPWGAITKFGVMKERMGDLLTDALRAQILRIVGYRVEIIEFIGGEHTPRNIMIRAVKTGAQPDALDIDRYREITTQWGIAPALSKKISTFTIG